MTFVDWTDKDNRRWAYVSAGACVLGALLLTLWLILQHLRHYTRPNLQRCIVRIVLMVPVRTAYRTTTTTDHGGWVVDACH